MQKFRKWKPTMYDRAGCNMPDHQDWEVLPMIITRDSEVDGYPFSNFHVAREALEEVSEECLEEGDWGVASFNHWLTGWLEIIIVKPDTPAHKVATEIEEALENHPVLDEDDWSEREHVYNSELLEGFIAYGLEEMLEDNGLVLDDNRVIEDLESICDMTDEFYQGLRDRFFNVYAGQQVDVWVLLDDIAFSNESKFRESTIEDSIDVVIGYLVKFHGYRTTGKFVGRQ